MIYTISFYGGEASSTPLSITIAIAVVHFVAIIFYHIITNVFIGATQEMILLNINKLINHAKYISYAAMSKLKHSSLKL